jgi:hypothetical protein
MAALGFANLGPRHFLEPLPGPEKIFDGLGPLFLRRCFDCDVELNTLQVNFR